MRKLFAVAVLVIAAFVVPAARGQGRVQDHDFIGADRCRACHATEFALWEKSPHARALEALAEKDRRDPRCLSCHTMVPDDVSAGLTGIQCESCHGPGRHYAIDFVMRDEELRKNLKFVAKIDEKNCLRCHTENSPSLDPFSYVQKLEAIKHWR